MRRWSLIAAAVTGMFAVAGCASAPPGTFQPGASAGPTGAPAYGLPTATGKQAAAPTPFPGTVKFEFGALPADPQQAQLATADRDFVLAYYEAIYTRGKNHGYRSYIGDKGMLRDVEANIAGQVAADRGYAGTVRFFDTSVTTPEFFASDKDVNYCVDEARLRHTNIVTGAAVADTRTANHHYYLESDMFAMDGNGTWKLVGLTVTYYPNSQAKECKP